MNFLRLAQIWRFRGREYRTITGLDLALFRDSGADSLSSVVDGRITAKTGDQVVAVYSVSSERTVERLP